MRICNAIFQRTCPSVSEIRSSVQYLNEVRDTMGLQPYKRLPMLRAAVAEISVLRSIT